MFSAGSSPNYCSTRGNSGDLGATNYGLFKVGPAGLGDLPGIIPLGGPPGLAGAPLPGTGL